MVAEQPGLDQNSGEATDWNWPSLHRASPRRSAARGGNCLALNLKVRKSLHKRRHAVFALPREHLRTLPISRSVFWRPMCVRIQPGLRLNSHLRTGRPGGGAATQIPRRGTVDPTGRGCYDLELPRQLRDAPSSTLVSAASERQLVVPKRVSNSRRNPTSLESNPPWSQRRGQRIPFDPRSAHPGLGTTVNFATRSST